eukprot:COSAG06_NODE_467_length_15342_cov_93.241225_11_plen_93_part_00
MRSRLSKPPDISGPGSGSEKSESEEDEPEPADDGSARMALTLLTRAIKQCSRIFMGANYSLVTECVDFATAAHTLAAVRWKPWWIVTRRSGP